MAAVILSFSYFSNIARKSRELNRGLIYSSKGDNKVIEADKHEKKITFFKFYL
jgi:hypothetical protein